MVGAVVVAVVLGLIVVKLGCTSIGPPSDFWKPRVAPNLIEERLDRAVLVRRFENLRHPCYSSDGRWLVVQGVGRLYILDAATLHCVWQADGIPSDCVTTFPDRNWGLFTDETNVSVFEIPSGEILKTISLPAKLELQPECLDGPKTVRPNPARFSEVQISPDGRLVAFQLQHPEHVIEDQRSTERTGPLPAASETEREAGLRPGQTGTARDTLE